MSPAPTPDATPMQGLWPAMVTPLPRFAVPPLNSALPVVEIVPLKFMVTPLATPKLPAPVIVELTPRVVVTAPLL